MKAFIITIDTESDNQWDHHSSQTTENAKYIPRFQELCEKYHFLPVYLTDYSMASNDYYCGYMKEKLQDRACEIGMHLHAWDTPPVHKIDRSENRPYLIEYPSQVMQEKIQAITDKLEETFQTKMLSHRAGRWAMNDIYARMLAEQGYIADCSVTPGVSWKRQMGSRSGGSNYTGAGEVPYYLDDHNHLLEIPMTVRRFRTMSGNTGGIKEAARLVKNSVFGKNIWLRPSINTEREILQLLAHVQKEKTDYLEFMIHSSEFMPGGSPYYPTEEAVNELFSVLERLFERIAKEYSGYTMADYANMYKANNCTEVSR